MRGYRDDDKPTDDFRITDARCDRETKAAIHVLAPSLDPAGIWIPKSQITDDSECYKTGTDGVLVVTTWFAHQRGWLESD